MKLFLILALILLSGCKKTPSYYKEPPFNCLAEGLDQATERQMCGDGIVRERYLGCGSYYKSICYSDFTLDFFKNDPNLRKIIKDWKRQGMVHCKKIKSYKTHPYIP